MIDTIRKWTGSVIGVARRVENLFDLQERSTKAIARLEEEVRALRLEVERLKAREDIVVVKAEAAAAVAAGSVALQTTADLARRLGGIEVQLRLLPSAPRDA